MAFKDLLVHIDDSETCAMRLEAAISIALAQHAQLTGLYLLPGYDFVFYADNSLGPELIEALRTAAQSRTAEQEAWFREETAKQGVNAQWHSLEGDPAQNFIGYARCHDLAVIGQPDPENPSPVSSGFISQVLLGSGRPALVIPYIGCQTPLGQRVLIAWNGSREAVRAVNDALPLLAGARQVRVLTIHPAGASDILSGTEICRHLARHGITAIPASLPASDLEAGDALLSWASDDNADLIITGAYGHSRLREIVLGGVTRHLLSHMTVPVMMSH